MATTSRKRRKKRTNADYMKEKELFHEIGLLIFLICMIILFLCNFNMIGSFGNYISEGMFGLFGLTAYILPIVLFIGVSFWYVNEGNPVAIRKLISGVVLFFMVGIACDLITKDAIGLTTYDIKIIYSASKEAKNGGGVRSEERRVGKEC